MLTTVGYAMSGGIAVAITLMGARYLLDPGPAAAGFGIPGSFGERGQDSAWLSVKGVRDIAMAIVIATLVINGAPRLLGWQMLVLALIPVADGAIVLRSSGPKVVAYGVHWATAGVMLCVAALLLI